MLPVALAGEEDILPSPAAPGEPGMQQSCRRPRSLTCVGHGSPRPVGPAHLGSKVQACFALRCPVSLGIFARAGRGTGAELSLPDPEEKVHLLSLWRVAG